MFSENAKTDVLSTLLRHGRSSIYCLKARNYSQHLIPSSNPLEDNPGDFFWVIKNC